MRKDAPDRSAEPAERLADALLGHYVTTAKKKPKGASAHRAIIAAWVEELCARLQRDETPLLRATWKDTVDLIVAHEVPTRRATSRRGIKYDAETIRKALQMIRANSDRTDAGYHVVRVANPTRAIAAATLVVRDGAGTTDVEVRLDLERADEPREVAVPRASETVGRPRILIGVRVEAARAGAKKPSARNAAGATKAAEAELMEEIERRRLWCAFVLGRDVPLDRGPVLTTKVAPGHLPFARAELVLPADVAPGSVPNFVAEHAGLFSAVHVRVVFTVRDVAAIWNRVKTTAATLDPQPYAVWDPLSLTPFDPTTLICSVAGLTYSLRRAASTVGVEFRADGPRDLARAMRGFPLLGFIRDTFGFQMPR